MVAGGVSRAPESSGNGAKPMSVETKEMETLWGATLIDQVGPTRYSSLAKLCGVVGYVRRAVKKWLACKGGPLCQCEAVLTVRELKAAFQDLCLVAQKGVAFPVTTLDRLVVSRDEVSGLLQCHGRVQAIAQGEAGVPLVPCNAWVSTLLPQEAHDANHEGVAGTLL